MRSKALPGLVFFELPFSNNTVGNSVLMVWAFVFFGFMQMTFAKPIEMSEKLVADSSETTGGFLIFEGKFVLGKQKSGGSCMSGTFHWTPRIDFNEFYGLKFELGGGVFKKQTGSPYFFIGEVGTLLNVKIFAPFLFEVGGGYSYWMGKGGYPAVMADFVLELSDPFFGFIDRMILSYTRVLDPSDSADLIGIGAALNFF